jgi:hypothetical protein
MNSRQEQAQRSSSTRVFTIAGTALCLFYPTQNSRVRNGEEGVMPKRKKKNSQKHQKCGAAAVEVIIKDDQNHSALESRILVVALLTATFIWSCSR